MTTMEQILNANFSDLKITEHHLFDWLNEPRKLICPYCYTPFKAVADHDVDMFDVLCPGCSEFV
jgi:hypothetical protein